MENTSRPSSEKLDQFAAELDALAASTRKKVGAQDARYIRRLIGVQRLIEIGGRITLVLGFYHPAYWILGVLLLSLSKILDNMEIGHNVLHGQYDWMNDPHINSRRYEWDIACDAGSWKRYHNHTHHTYTNIIGKDRDYGYGLLRLSDDIRWKPKNRFQMFTYVLFSLLFEWGVAYHELAGERIFLRKKRKNKPLTKSQKELRRAFFRKINRQVFKDYLFFPLLSAGILLSWTVALQVLLGNLLANTIRNLWTSTVIFCGHFTEEAQTFKESDCQDETQGHWYYRQILGSSNFTGSKVFHILTGHLSYQIEHHLFPDMPAPRYREMAPGVQRICKKYGIPYNSYRFGHQYWTVLQRIMTYSRKRPIRSKMSPA